MELQTSLSRPLLAAPRGARATRPQVRRISGLSSWPPGGTDANISHVIARNSSTAMRRDHAGHGPGASRRPSARGLAAAGITLASPPDRAGAPRSSIASGARRRASAEAPAGARWIWFCRRRRSGSPRLPRRSRRGAYDVDLAGDARATPARLARRACAELRRRGAAPRRRRPGFVAESPAARRLLRAESGARRAHARCRCCSPARPAPARRWPRADPPLVGAHRRRSCRSTAPRSPTS